MTAREARAVTEAAVARSAREAEASLAAKKAAETQFEIDLKGKYAIELKDAAIAKIKAMSLRALTSCAVKCKWQDGEGLKCCDAARALLIADGYSVEVKTEDVEAYHQDGHFDEGNYSHDAFTRHWLVISW